MNRVAASLGPLVAAMAVAVLSASAAGPRVCCHAGGGPDGCCARGAEPDAAHGESCPCCDHLGPEARDREADSASPAPTGLGRLLPLDRPPTVQVGTDQEPRRSSPEPRARGAPVYLLTTSLRS